MIYLSHFKFQENRGRTPSHPNQFVDLDTDGAAFFQIKSQKLIKEVNC